MNIKAWVTTRRGNQFEVTLPAKRIVCPSCDGTGTELRGGLKGAVISEENLADPDFCRSYFGGGYDTYCSVCKGEKVVIVVDHEALTPKMAARFWRAVNDQADHEAEVAAEKRFWARAYGER